MYQRNLIDRNVLITPQEVIKKTPGSQTLDVAKYMNAIEIAEERFVRPALGSEFYDYLIDAKNVVVTSGNIVVLQAVINGAYGVAETTPDSLLKVGDVVNAYEFLLEADQKLWKTYLWKIVAECVHFVAIPENYAQFTSQGINKNNPIASIIENSSNESVGISLSDAKWLMDKWLEDRINPMINAMHVWLCKYKDNYPRYDRECVCDNDGDIIGNNVGGWITDLYDDDNENNGRRCRC
ncbi:MAG: hypothetical protein WC756_17665 [Taibaiella sp.]|jgi:hypothetical protein